PAYMSVRTSEHSEQWLAGFARAVAAIPAITELYRMTGDVDYLLKLHVASMADYDAVYRKLIALVKLTDVSTAFVMEEIKHTTELPLAVHAPEEG
ncbi:MAG TPA: Lrp/AsnC family transcriptional regulator, partial [Novosphingobium sp.]|nr:Lrp/AsnC family transcriptional regulator [Novosphingobium sp.]